MKALQATQDRIVVTVEARGKLMLSRSFVAGLPVRIGRATDSHVCLPIQSVSRLHLTVLLVDGRIRLTDSSSQGTQVGNDWLRQAERTFDDQTLDILVGGYKIIVKADTRDTGPLELRRVVHQKLIDRLDLARYPRSGQISQTLRDDVHSALAEIVQGLAVSVSIQKQIARDVADETLGLGPLEALLNDESIAEIMVVDPNVIYVEREGRLELTGRSFSDADAVRAVIERIVTPLGRRIDESSPLVDARLPDGSRVNAVIPPLAVRGPCITIRKFRASHLTLEELTQKGSLSTAMGRFLRQAVQAKKNIVISGGTGSGKTTLLNLLSGAIPETERIVTIEDAAELSLRQEHVVSLESRPPNLEGKGEFTIRDLVKNALRMRPDRIVVGECRGGEALDMLQAMNTGHEGSMTTTHANSPREALGRIETLCLMSGVELPLSAIRRQIASSLHLVVQQARLSDGSRKVIAISEVTGLSPNGDVELIDLYQHQIEEYDDNGRIRGRFVATGFIPTFSGELEKLEGGRDG